MIPFYLRKWYLDLTSEDGTVLYLYFILTRVAGIAGGSVSAHVRLPDGKSVRVALNRKVTLLEPKQSAVCRENFLVNEAGAAHAHLEFPQLILDLNYRSNGNSWSPAEDGVLLRRGDHFLSWQVPLPAADVDGMIQVGAERRRLTGVGYQDLVVMTLAPWRLPVAELSWGRAHCGACTVVFDQLRLTDGACLQYLLLRAEDGAFESLESGAFTIEAGAGERESILRHSRFTLRLAQKHLLAEGAIAAGGQIPFNPLRKFLGRLSGNPREAKMISDAELSVAGRTHTGAAIHERVVWSWKDGP